MPKVAQRVSLDFSTAARLSRGETTNTQGGQYQQCDTQTTSWGRIPMKIIDCEGIYNPDTVNDLDAIL